MFIVLVVALCKLLFVFFCFFSCVGVALCERTLTVTEEKSNRCKKDDLIDLGFAG